MTGVRTPREVFFALIDGVCSQRWSELPELYAPGARVHHPLATDSSALLIGREQLREHFSRAGNAGMAMQARDVVVHETGDPEVIVAEFAYHGRVGGRAPIKVPAVFVLRVRNGEIVESRDYIGPGQPLL